jgi:hypothetical protein
MPPRPVTVIALLYVRFGDENRDPVLLGKIRIILPDETALFLREDKNKFNMVVHSSFMFQTESEIGEVSDRLECCPLLTISSTEIGRARVFCNILFMLTVEWKVTMKCNLRA